MTENQSEKTILRRTILVLSWPVFLTFCISVAMTILATFLTIGQIRDREHLRFERDADRVTEDIRKRFVLHDAKLRGAAALFVASQSVERDEWHDWVSAQNLETILPGVQGLGYCERVTSDNKDAFVRRVRAEGFKNFDIKPPGDRPEHYCTLFIEPFEGRNLRAFGYDMFSDESRRTAIEQARDTGGLAITGKVRLVQETDADQQAGFLMYLAVYEGSTVPASIEERRERIKGLVYMPFRMNDLMSGILGDRQTNVLFSIYDGSEVDAQSLMYTDEVRGVPVPRGVAPFETRRQVEYGARVWLLDFNSPPATMLSPLYFPAFGVAIAGSIISLLLAAISWYHTTARARAERAASHMTAEIRVANARIEASFEELKARNKSVTILNEASETLQACRTEEEAHKALAIVCERLMPGYSGTIFAKTEEGTILSSAVSWGGTQHSAESFGMDDCWALRKGRPHFAAPRISMACPHVKDTGSTYCICVPITASQRMFGVLHLEISDDFTLGMTQDQIDLQKQLAITIAEQAALSLANIRLRSELHDKSIRDPLTGLYNRRHLDSVIAKEFEHARAGENPVGVVVVDLDFFKKFNDNFGHDAGDYLLKEAAKTLRTSVRAGDCTARFGGEEFVVVLPNTTLEEAAKVAENLRIAISKLVLSFNGTPLGNVTASMGVAAFPQHGDDPAEVFRRADTALYSSKKNGRNRVTLAEVTTVEA